VAVAHRPARRAGAGAMTSYNIYSLAQTLYAALVALGQNLPLIMALGLGFLFLLLWKVPQWQASGVQDLKDRLTLENAVRQTLAQIVGGIVIIVGLYLTAATLWTTQEGQITDRLTKAIEQLGAVDQAGHIKLEVRLGGIYALARLARDSQKDYWPIREVLAAYIRENAPRKAGQALEIDLSVQPAADIQAALTALATLSRAYKEDRLLDLARTDLRGANLIGAFFRSAFLVQADLRGAQLLGANLRDAALFGADLREALLSEADLRGADLSEARLSGARFGGTVVSGKPLGWAILHGALLSRADLRGARNLTLNQLANVKTLYQALLDLPLLAGC
jgi:hypothetical protein